jgi:hypothetical protein
MISRGWPQEPLLWFWRGLILVLLSSFLTASGVPMMVESQRVQRYTRASEFEFLGWTAGAVGAKITQHSLGTTSYLSGEARRSLVLEYFDLVTKAAQLDGQVQAIFGDPSIADPELEAVGVRAELSAVRARISEIQPIFESVLSEQISTILAEQGLGLGGEVLPPVAFHVTRTPLALIASPRDVIRQEANIQLDPGLSVEARINLEARVETGTNLSALVVPVGGLGTYPTMVQESSAVSWVVETIVHEWIHNYLTFRPLGLNYGTSAELRTMNETVASILGRELGRSLLARYYPDHLPPPETEPELVRESESDPPAFDFRAEMRETRVTVDRLLEQDRIEEAEAYMRERREVFWEHGYRIRKLNQAYFAFYGAYADRPGGAAGEDPVGEAVRELWERVQNPRRFLRIVAWMDEFSDLQAELGG